MRCWYCSYEVLHPKKLNRQSYKVCPQCDATTVERLPIVEPKKHSKVEMPSSYYEMAAVLRGLSENLP